jgi:hypothetical protein
MIKLKGKSNKGKQLLKKLGVDWVIVERHDSCQCFDGRRGWLIAPIDATIGEKFDSMRWIEPINDKDFEVIK